jgi:hypothetical protein
MEVAAENVIHESKPLPLFHRKKGILGHASCSHYHTAENFAQTGCNK